MSVTRLEYFKTVCFPYKWVKSARSVLLKHVGNFNNGTK